MVDTMTIPGWLIHGPTSTPIEPEDVPGTETGIPEMPTDNRWSVKGNTYFGANDTCTALPAGVYNCASHPNMGYFFDAHKLKTDSILSLPGEPGPALVEEFKRFWDREPLFRERGFLVKRGMLIHGPAGSGKTSAINLMMAEIVRSYNGIVVLVECPGTFSNCLRLLRKVEPERHVLAVMEDLDALAQEYGEAQFLSLLDGESQVDRIMFIATTNYMERLDPRFKNRPSRFDTVQYIGMPSAEARAAYLRAKEPSLSEAEIERWVAVSEGFSVAHLKELIVAVQCLGQTLEQAIGRLEEMRQQRASSENNPEREFGFSKPRGRRL
jgi:hypothetical protein